jgi:hypothetical protein
VDDAFNFRSDLLASVQERLGTFEFFGVKIVDGKVVDAVLAAAPPRDEP